MQNPQIQASENGHDAPKVLDDGAFWILGFQVIGALPVKPEKLQNLKCFKSQALWVQDTQPAAASVRLTLQPDFPLLALALPSFIPSLGNVMKPPWNVPEAARLRPVSGAQYRTALSNVHGRSYRWTSRVYKVKGSR